MYEKAITMGKGGTRAERSPAEEAAWRERVQGIATRAEACLRAHGATGADLARDEHGTPTVTQGIIDAARSFFATITGEQYEAIRPAARGDDPTHGTVIDLWDGAALFPGSGQVRMFDEYVPCAEALWPETA